MAKGFNLTAQLNLKGPTNVKSVVSNIQKQLNGIKANVNVIVSPNASANLTKINKQISTLNKSLGNTSAFANNATQAIANLGKALSTANNAAVNLPKNLSSINSAGKSASQGLASVSNQVKKTNTEFEEFGRLSALAVKRFAAFSIGTAVFYKLGNAISSSLQEFISFDRELVRIAQVTDTSLKNLSSLEKEVTRLSTAYGVSSTELIKVSTTLAQAGLTAKDTERALQALAKSSLAPSFDDMNQTVEGSIALMRQFGISAADLEKALGSINSVAAKFAVEASDIITAIQRTGGVFATASKGVSEGKDALNEFIAVFTSIRATTRESAETIATGLRTIFARIQRAETIEQLKQFGVTLTDAEGKFVGAYKAVELLSKGLSGLDPRSLDFSRIVEELGGFRQIGKVIPLIQQFTVTQQALAVAQKGQGSLTKDAADAQQALAVKISKVKQEFDALIRSVGQSQGFKDMIMNALELASALIKIADAAKGVLPALTALVAIKGLSAALQFGRGFVGGLRRQHEGGPVRGFARGGLVPGSGNGDTVPAMLQPGEFVIRKNAVNTIGSNNLHRMNKYALGGSVKAKGSVLSGTYRSLSKVVDPEQTYNANIIPRPIASNDQGIIKRMIENKKKSSSLPMWKNFELALSSRFGLNRAGGNYFLDFPNKPGEAKFLKPDQGYASDLETGFIKGNNNLTMLAKLVGSGKYKPGQAISAYYPVSPASISSQVAKASMAKMVKKASGGGISGEDTVPALLTPGEFVINKKAASRIGSARLHQMNRADRVRGYNKGGIVQRFASGGFSSGLSTDIQSGLGLKGMASVDAAAQKAAAGFQRLMTGTDAFGAALISADAKEAAGQLKAFARAIEKGKTEAEAIDDAIKAGAAANRRYSDAADKAAKKLAAEKAGLTSSRQPASAGAAENRAARSVGAPGTFTSATGFNGQDVSKKALNASGGLQQSYVEKMSRQAAQKFSDLGYTSDIAKKSLLVFNTQLKQTGNAQTAMTAAMNSAAQSYKKSGLAQSMNPVTAGGGGPGMFGGMANAVGYSGVGTVGGAFGGRLGRVGGALRRGIANNGAMAGMALTMGGGLAVEGMSKAYGGEQTEKGRTISAVGNNVVNMAGMGAAIGSIFGPLGTAVGAAAGGIMGWVQGLKEAEAANKEYARSQAEKAREIAGEKSAENLTRYQQIATANTGRNNVPIRQAQSKFMESLTNTAAAEERSYFTENVDGKKEGESQDEYIKRIKNTQIAGSQQAQGFLEFEMNRTGKSSKDVMAGMSVTDRNRIKKEMAQTDDRYIQEQTSSTRRERELEKQGKTDEARAEREASQARLLKMEEEIAKERLSGADALLKAKLAEEERIKALKEADHAARQTVVSLKASVEAMNQSNNVGNFSVQEGNAKIDAITSGNRRMPNLNRDINVLQNPLAYGAADRQAALQKGSFGLGKDADPMMKLANFSVTGRQAITQAASTAKKAGITDPQEVGNSVIDAIGNQITGAFGDNAISSSIMGQVEAQVNSLVEQKKKDGGDQEITDAEIQDIIDGISGLNGMFETADQAMQAFVQRLEMVNAATAAYGQALDKVTAIENDRVNIRAETAGTLASTDNQVNDILGKKLSLEDMARPRLVSAAMKAGVTPENYNVQGLQQERKALKASAGIQEGNLQNLDPTNPAEMQAYKDTAMSMKQLDEATKRAEQGIMDLPDFIKGSMEDTMGKLKEAVDKFNAIQAKSESMAETIVGSTPQQVKELNDSYAMMDRALQGNLESIHQNRGAQEAYFKTLQSGGTQQDAQQAAQTAYAQQIQNALKMFDDMAELGGMEKPQRNMMKADMLENMANAQGYMTPMVKSMIDNLRKTPENDPEVQKLLTVLEQQKQQFVEAQVAADQLLAEKQGEIITQANQNLVEALNNAARAFEQAQTTNQGLGISRPGDVVNNGAMPMGGAGAAGGAGRPPAAGAGAGGAAGRPPVANAGAAAGAAGAGRPQVGAGAAAGAPNKPQPVVVVGGPGAAKPGPAPIAQKGAYNMPSSTMTQPQKYVDPSTPTFQNNAGTAAGGRERRQYMLDQRKAEVERQRQLKEDAYNERKAARGEGYRTGGMSGAAKADREYGQPTAGQPFSKGATSRVSARNGQNVNVNVTVQQPAQNNGVVGTGRNQAGGPNNSQQANSGQGVLNIDGLNIFVNKFDQFVKNLQALQIPTKFEHNHSIEVNFTGDMELLASLTKEDGPLASWVVGKIEQRFSKLSRDTEGAVS